MSEMDKAIYISMAIALYAVTSVLFLVSELTVEK